MPFTVGESLLEAIPQLVWINDTGGAVTYVNRRWCEYTGMTFEESLGDGWRAAVHAGPAGEDYAVRLDDAGEAQPAFEVRRRIRRSDGTYRWFLARGVTMLENGRVIGMIGTNTDIEDEVRFEQALSASEERYRKIIDTAQEGIWIVDTSARTRYVNERMCTMLGYSPDEMYGTPFASYVHPAQAERARDMFDRRVRAGESGQSEYRYRRRDGSDLWALVATNPILDETGAPNGALAMISDITDRKAMEVRLATAAAEYRSLAEATPQIVWTAAGNGEFDYVNSRWSEYTGISAPAAQHWGWLPAIHIDDVPHVLERWQDALASGAAFEATVRVRRAADDTFRWHVMRARQLAGPGGGVRWFGTLTDIDDERRTARQLHLIARASSVLAASFDRDALLEGLAELIVAELAQSVVIAVFDAERRLRVVGTAHRDGDAGAILAQLRGTHPLRPEMQAAGEARIAQSDAFGGTLSAIEIAAALRPEFAGIASAAGGGPFVCAPLRALGTTTGAILAFAPAGGVFTPAETVIFTEIAARAAAALENAELYAREARVATTLQQALLPTRLPVIAGLAFDAIYQPGATEAQIGGDWYDAVELADGRVLVSIGDVTGRGLRAAVIMGRVRQAIEALATYQTDPMQLLNAADAVLRRAYPDAIVTALVGVIDRARSTFAYATAGHPTPIVRAPGLPAIVLPGTGLPLGLRDLDSPPTSTVVLPPDSLIALYTDGLTESTRDVYEGERRLHAALADDAIAFGDQPAHAISQRVLFDGSADDVAVFTVRLDSAAVAPAPGESPLRSEWSMHWSFDARDTRSMRAVRELFVSYLRAQGASGEDYGAAELVFGELLGNVARHAPGIVDVEVDWQGEAPVLHVLDRGDGYDVNAFLPDDELEETGRGLFLVKALTRAFTVTRLPGYGAHARVELAIRRASRSA